MIIYLPICLLTHPYTHPSIYLSVSLPIYFLYLSNDLLMTMMNEIQHFSVYNWRLHSWYISFLFSLRMLFLLMVNSLIWLLHASLFPSRLLQKHFVDQLNVKLLSYCRFWTVLTRIWAYYIIASQLLA